MKNLKKFAVVLLALALVVSVFAACDLKITPEQKIKGAWRDSTGTMGYEFLDNNACKITYADVTIPIINITYDGTVDGTYAVSKDDAGLYHVTVIYTILSKSVTKDYIFSVDGNALTLTDVASGTITTLLAYSEAAPVSTSAAAQ